MKKSFGKYISWGILVVFVILFILSIFYRSIFVNFFSARMKEYGYFILFIGSMLMEGIPQYVAPQLLAFNAFLLGFPFWQTILVLYAGSITGSVIGFEVGLRSKSVSGVQFVRRDKFIKIREKFNKHGHWFVFLTSISPLPYLPYVFGVLKVKRKDFIFYGVLPRIIYFFYISIIANAVF